MADALEQDGDDVRCRHKMLEGQGSIPNEHTSQKKMLFHSFPRKYQKSFCEAGKILADCKKVQVVAFFNTLYVQDKKSGTYANLKNKRDKKHQNSDDEDDKEINYKKRSCKNGGRNGGGCGGYNGNCNNNLNGGGNGSNTPCQLHNGQHLWRNWYNNRNRCNYHPPSNNGGGRGNAGNKNHNDAHHNDDAGGKKSKAKNKNAEVNFVDSAGSGMFESD